MKDCLKIVLLAIILLAIVLAARWLIEVGSGEVDVRVQRDTVFVCDTTFIHDTIPKIVYERTVKYIPTPKDTVFVGDSVTFVAADSIPVIQRQYSGNGYEAWVSGYEPQLDSIHVERVTETREVTVTNTITVRKKSSRISVGLACGYGYGIQIGHGDYFVGLGLNYRIWP